MSLPRRGLLALALAPLAHPALARPVWFDPTQLPSYSGRLDRWIMNPAGAVDRGLFIEGTQFVCPAAIGDRLQTEISRNAPLTIWGIRARSAPVVTVFAWSRSEDGAQFVERPDWFGSDEAGQERLSLAGKIQAPLLTPQGEPMGVILEGHGAIRLNPETHKKLGDKLAPGVTVAAEGMGTRRGEFVSLDAERIGEAADRLAPIPGPGW